MSNVGVGCWVCSIRHECKKIVGCEKTPQSFNHASPKHGSNHGEHISRRNNRINKRINKIK